MQLYLASLLSGTGGLSFKSWISLNLFMMNGSLDFSVLFSYICFVRLSSRESRFSYYPINPNESLRGSDPVLFDSESRASEELKVRSTNWMFFSSKAETETEKHCF